jgi:predicted metal-dependent HD superfamily phosphohydrolase
MLHTSRGADPVLIDAVFDDLEARHRDRPHHHLGRVLGMLDRIDELDHRLHEPVAVRLAAWVAAVEVDAAVPDRHGSARWAARRLPELGAPAAEVATVTGLLTALAGHDPCGALDRTRGGDSDCGGPGGPDAAVLCDADLAGLGDDPDGYARRLAELRREGGPAWPAIRAEQVRVLRRRESVFRTPELRATREGRAQLNLAREAAGAGYR